MTIPATYENGVFKPLEDVNLTEGARVRRPHPPATLLNHPERWHTSLTPPTPDIARRAYYLMKTHAKPPGLQTLDSLIAATALEEGLTLASKNRKHFQMIEDLKLEVPNY